ncbi:protein-glutamate methylesterase/protein-glutamine glutaminase [Botrimarina hoheduenensis]|uniref:Protein-glutamate methylesterase/protein-glutamine glutaminase n=1 Tax=Botrimarina hoheduenensis TaxID=2528000 RepID=A0A5C5WC63_9BACT|nr:chemotaxis response regulator protein-glutamate methylesterase [Botrimarina hoheduenensis]TWT48260.1 Chemotaxis response regulator protein-glutamate methylesterase [Botrimarina hoheduenensis]
MSGSSPLKCLVVDDSALYRKIVRDVLAGMPDVEVVGIASDGQQALTQIEALRPDVVTLDLEMPRLDGIGVLRELQARGLDVAAIMVSAFTARGAKATTQALQLGAFDFILKPATNSLEESIAQLRQDLGPKLRACLLRRAGKQAKSVARVAPTAALPASAVSAARIVQPRPPQRPARFLARHPEIVAIGVSTGGPQALTQLLPLLPANFPAPVLLVQHMPPMFTKSLADDLDRRCSLRVMEASHGQPVRVGEILIAPGGKHMRVARLATGLVVQLTDDPPERNCRPAVDYLFRSVAQHYGGATLAAVLTGMGDDGTLGAKAIKQAGGLVLAQDEASCVVYGMPKSVVENQLADIVAPLNRLHEHLLKPFAGRIAI